MKLLFTILISALVATFATFLLVHLHFTGLFPWEDEANEGVITTSLQSNILHETREIVITLPRNYSPQKEYPVLYILDGGLLQGSAAALDVLAVNGYAPETIVVGIPNPSAETRQRDLTPPYMLTDIDDSTSAPGSGDKFLDFMQQELIPFIDNKYATSNYRLISGNSRGGLLVLHSLMSNPDLFQARFCYSSPFWRQDEIILRKISAFINKADSLNTFLFFSAGEAETENIRSGCTNLAALLQQKSTDGLVWSYQFTALADHQTNSHLSVGKAMGLWGRYFQQQD